MHRVPRDEWIEWCERLRTDRARRLETVGSADRRKVIVSIDYAPFDDILELDLRDRGSVVRRLIDHPSQILVDDLGRSVLIGSGEGIVRLVLTDARRPGSGGHPSAA